MQCHVNISIDLIIFLYCNSLWPKCTLEFSEFKLRLAYMNITMTNMSLNPFQLEEKERKRIEAEKEEERRRATEAIERWKEKQSEAQLQIISNGDEDSEEDNEGQSAETEATKGVFYHKQLSGDADNEHGSDSEDEMTNVAEPEMIRNSSPRKQNCKQRKIHKKKSPTKSGGKFT